MCSGDLGQQKKVVHKQGKRPPPPHCNTAYREYLFHNEMRQNYAMKTNSV